MLRFEQCFILFCSFPLLFAFVVGGLGFEFCVFVAGWRHALRSEWPFIIIIIIKNDFSRQLKSFLNEILVGENKNKIPDIMQVI